MTYRHVLTPQLLSAETFRPYGDVIEASNAAQRFGINGGNAQRFHDLAKIDTSAEGGHPMLSIFRALPRALPLQLVLMERHPLGSQAFVPLSPHPFLVVVAAPGALPEPTQWQCFWARPGQGVNYARGTWHHPLLALVATSDFLVIDRGGPELPGNCEERPMAGGEVWIERGP
jgi:ureidoglycolate lyase